MSTLDITIDGLDEALSALRRAGVSTRPILRAAAQAGADLIAEAARANAPGPEIESDVVESTATAITVDVGPTKPKWYYRFFETGAGPHAIQGKSLLVFDGEQGLVRIGAVQHPGQAAQPFLRPAFDAQGDNAVDIIANRLRSAIETA